MIKNIIICFLIANMAVIVPLCAQQVEDTTYSPSIRSPRYEYGTGPVIMIDAAHFNFHTKEGRFKPFATLLERDGYQVKSLHSKISAAALQECSILVLSNALSELNSQRWYRPVLSAFTPEEIRVIKDWVASGGSLFLIADHMPFAGAASDLASVFGFRFTDGFAMLPGSNTPAFFSYDDQSLHHTLVTPGHPSFEAVDSIVTFTGQAFEIPGDATPVLTFGEGWVNLLPDTAWVFDETTKTESIGGWSQGAYKVTGKGKIYVSGEAAMFSAQLAGPNQIKMGMNAPYASHNYQLLLNIIHWLDDVAD